MSVPNADHGPDSDVEKEYGSNALWGWIVGAVVLMLILVFLFRGTTENTTTPVCQNNDLGNGIYLFQCPNYSALAAAVSKFRARSPDIRIVSISSVVPSGATAIIITEPR